MIRAVVLSALLLAGLAFGETSLPAKVTMGDHSFDGTLEINNDLATLVFGNERHLINLGFSEIDAADVRKLEALAAEDSEAQYRAIPFELGDSQKNAKFLKIHLRVSTSKLGGYQVNRAQLEFRYLHQGVRNSESRMVNALVGIQQMAAPFPIAEKESYGVAFDQNVLPVRLLEIISQPTTDRHGNKITVRRARVASLAELRQTGRSNISVYDVPAGALVFLTADQTAHELERVSKHGMAEEEFHEAERYLLGEAEVDPAKDLIEQLVKFGASRKLDVEAIQNRLIKEEFAEKARVAKDRERAFEMGEDAKRVTVLLSDFMSDNHEGRMGRLAEIQSMVPLRGDAYEQLVNLLSQFAGGSDVKETRETIAKILAEAAPLPPEALVALMREANPLDPSLALLFQGILRGANKENAVENLALRMAMDPTTPIEDRAVARRTMAMLPASGSTKALLLVAMSADQLEVQTTAMESLKAMGPYETPFLMEIVKLLKDNRARSVAVELLIGLQPAEPEVVHALTALVRDPSEEVRDAAAKALDKLHSNFGNLDEDVIAAINHCRHPRPPSAQPPQA